jgi:aminoglycoside phosphotransferase (APT) family kinase protein
MHGGDVNVVVALPGMVNRVFRVRGLRTDWVVRFPLDDQRANEFPTEVWAARQAHSSGVPTARTVATGLLDARPYLIVEYVEPHQDQDEDQAWRWLGRYASRVATTRLDEAPEEVFSRFGRDLPRAWRAHLSYNLDAVTAQDPLLEDGVYQEADRVWLRASIKRLMTIDFAFGLAHGDLAPRNLVPRRPPLPPVLLDWGTATTGPAPWTDLQRVYGWATYDRTVTKSALDHFAHAAGVPLDEQTSAVLEQMSALRFLDLARWARKWRPDLYEEYRQSSQQGLAVILSTP